jgi:cation diffusion facilitator family transporter
MDTQARPGDGVKETSRAAAASVLAAVLLTGTKLGVGLATGSLGILSEAAHSTLDLLAAVVTWFAVRASARPADEGHPYGHGKVENLSALFETALLLVTCAWITLEAIRRLVRPVPVRASFWGFAVILLSIGVDLARSRALRRAARRYGSQALEADALHFSTDIWSSAVVLFGLAMVRLADLLALPALRVADALAALAVAGIVVVVSVNLGRRAVDDLMDSVPRDYVHQARTQVLAVPGVVGVSQIRMRRTGRDWFSDVTITVADSLSAVEAHRVAEGVEAALRVLMARGDIIVHVDPRTVPGAP